MTLRNKILRNILISQWLMLSTGALFVIGTFFDSQDALQQAVLKSESGHFVTVFTKEPERSPLVGPTISAYLGREQLPPMLEKELPSHEPGVYELDFDEGLGIVDEREVMIEITDIDVPDKHLYVVSDILINQADWSLVRQILVLLSVYVLITLIIGGWWGWFSSRKISKPLEQITAQLRQSTADDPTTELTTIYSDGEIGELARTLDEKNHRIARFIQREQNIMRNISHEFRTPITVIKSTLGLLRGKPGQDQVMHEHGTEWEKIARANQDLESMIETFLWLGREDETATGDTDATACVERAIAEHQYLLELKSIELDIDLDRMVHVDCREVIFYICVANLLRNAFSYTERGKIFIRLTESCLIVDDNGPGLAESKNGEPTSECNAKGFGLGLNIVNQVCERMQWQLTLESKGAGMGTRAILIFF